MLKVYKPINHNIYNAHQLIEYLVDNVWCVADSKYAKSKLNPELKGLYDKYGWLKTHINNIYKICKILSAQEKIAFKNAFHTNNKIEELCDRTIQPVLLDTLNTSLVDAIKPFFKELYSKFLGWKLVSGKYGTKKEYYNALFLANCFTECPCCNIDYMKTIYSKGHSPLDHYLPQKYYPFSAINFNNLVPLCHSCNSGYKGEKDILKGYKRIFYPFASSHLIFEVNVFVLKDELHKLITRIGNVYKSLDPKVITIYFNIEDERIESWDSIFSIRERYFETIASYRISWINDVREKYKIDQSRIPNYSIETAFEDIIKSDSGKQLGFLKSSYLSDLKSHAYLVKAMEEVSTHSRIL